MLIDRRRVAEAVSLVLNAPFIAMLTFLILINYVGPPSPLTLILFSSLFSTLLPILIVYLMTKRGVIPDLFASDRSTRFKPFTGAAASYLLGVVALRIWGAPSILVYLMACYLINSLVMMGISLRWKISIHASGIAGPSAFLMKQVGLWTWPFWLLALPICWARLELGAHSLGQVAGGIILTTLLTLLQLALYPYLLIIPPL